MKLLTLPFLFVLFSLYYLFNSYLFQYYWDSASTNSLYYKILSISDVAYQFVCLLLYFVDSPIKFHLVSPDAKSYSKEASLPPPPRRLCNWGNS